MENKALIEQIFKANLAYRNGKEIMPDSEYDNLLDKLKQANPSEYNTIRPMLLDPTTKDGVELPVIVGSLEKLKNGHDSDIQAWANEQKQFTGDYFIVTSKVDGLSLLLCYYNGELKLITTRGDGKTGENKTEKLKGIVPAKLTGRLSSGLVIIRGEGVLEDDAFKELNKRGVTYRAKRNAAVGLVNSNSKKFDGLCTEFLTFVGYQIYKSEYKFRAYSDVLLELNNQGIRTPKIHRIKPEDMNSDNLMNIYEGHKLLELFDIDGLVIQSNYAFNELDKYLPEHSIAFKANQLSGVTTVEKFEWEVSKDGSLRPIAVVTPIVLNNALISKASTFNTEWIRNNKCGIGAKVEIQMQGDIIPGISSILEPSENYNFPMVCPSCGKPIKEKNKFFYCTNPGCKTRAIKSLSHFIRNLDIGFAGDTNLENWRIYSINDLIQFEPATKQQEKFCKELKDKLWNISEHKLIESFDYSGVGKKQINKIIDANSLEDFIKFFFEDEDIHLKKPIGITESTFKRIKDGIKLNDISNSYHSIVYNSKWHKHYKEYETTIDSVLAGQSFCFTGALTIPRKTAEKLVLEKGGSVKNAVIKGLTYLVSNDPNSGSTKNKKALELGINIISEKTFFSLVDYQLPESLKSIASIMARVKKKSNKKHVSVAAEIADL